MPMTYPHDLRKPFSQQLDDAFPVPPELRCSYQYQWQCLKWDLTYGSPGRKAYIVEHDGLEDWQRQLSYWKKQRTWSRTEDRDYNERHVKCIESIIAMLVQLRLEAAP